MKRLLPLILAVSALGLAGCGDPSGGMYPDSTPKPLVIKVLGFRHDERALTVRVPQMKTMDCQQRIVDALAKTEGVRASVPDLANHAIEVKYNALKLGIKNIEFTIANAGFDANDTPANAEARAALPPECR